MISTIHENKVFSARKDYRCNTCKCMGHMDGFTLHDLTEAEKDAIERAKENDWKIKKGEPYIRQFNTDGGDTWTFRAIPAIYQICLDHDLYGDY